jgi:NAD(P)-dependent dehydrogenase (short-subunit alcohol dehydrogenase family)
MVVKLMSVVIDQAFMENLSGRTAVVTGGGSGIGRAICFALSAEGMQVVVADREARRAERVAAEIEATGHKAIAVTCDVADQTSVDALAAQAYEELGPVSLLCNNAGILQMGPVADASLDDWHWLFSVNLFGVVHGCRAFVPRMRAQAEPAHIVNTSSLSGIFAVPALGVYTAAKYAVVALSETLRVEEAHNGIGVSVLCPGPTPSRIGETARIDRNMPPQFTEGDADLTYLGMREPAQVAACLVEAVKANRLYAFSHAPGRIAAEKRFNATLEDFSFAP